MSPRVGPLPPETVKVTTVLVVDDNPNIRDSVAELLRLDGYSVACAQNGRDAIEQQRRLPVDIVVTDLFMPESDGFELIQALLKCSPTTKVVAMSGAQASYLRMAALIGVHAVISKPVDAEILCRTLESLR